MSLLSQNAVGIATWIGVAVSVVGFTYTIYRVSRSETAAERASEAAEETREKIRQLQTVEDFGAALAKMEEIKRLHRAEAWNILPDRYSTLRKSLVRIRSGNPDRINDEDAVIIQRSIQALRDFEKQVDRALEEDTATPDGVLFNQQLSALLDDLHEVLVRFTQGAGENHEHG